MDRVIKGKERREKKKVFHKGEDPREFEHDMFWFV